MVTVLSSMATKVLLAELAAGRARVESVGGVDAARRIRDGEAVDVLVLADGAMAKLETDGFVRDRVAIAVSPMAAAVRDGDAVPDLTALRHAILQAGRIGYSTGPSGDNLLRLLERWGLHLGDRLVQAPPGVPVGRLLAEGKVDLAFQQRSELMDISGVTLAFPVPGGDTVFTAGVVRTSPHQEAARGFVDFLASAQHDAAKRRCGMEPAQ